ncbi:MAG: DUF2946 family protein [Planctomycetota bacterium]|jgi:hypothetical protein
MNRHWVQILVLLLVAPSLSGIALVGHKLSDAHTQAGSEVEVSHLDIVGHSDDPIDTPRDEDRHSNDCDWCLVLSSQAPVAVQVVLMALDHAPYGRCVELHDMVDGLDAPIEASPRAPPSLLA